MLRTSRPPVYPRAVLGAALTVVIMSAIGATPAAAQTVTRGPYLQNGSNTAVSFRWRTSTATNSRVSYGTTQGNLSSFADDATSTTEHEVRVTGLSPNTKYFYAIGTTTTILAGNDANHFVLTAPTTGTAKPTRIWVLGDPGTGSSSQTAVRDAYYSFTGSTHTDLWLMLGDNAYSSSTDAEMQANLFNIYPTMLRKSVLFPTRGNHESATSGGVPVYYLNHTMPTNGEAGGVPSGTEAYYSFDYGNVHFVCLDSFGTSRSATGAMATWLQNDLAANTQQWTIAYWHHPPYSKGSHNSDTESALIEMRQNFNPILENGGVDLVLGGHSHAYERSFFLDEHYGSSTTFSAATHVVQPGNGREDGNGAYTKSSTTPIPHAGAVYVVAGSSGQTSGGTLNHPAMFISLNLLGSLVLDINGTRLDAKFLRNTGAIDDYFTIIKSGGGGGAPPAPTGLVATPGNSQVALSWNAATGAATYNVKRSTTSGGPYSPIQTGVATTSFTDTTVSNGTTYYYVVSGVSSGGQEGPNSTQASATPSAPGVTPIHQQAVTGTAGSSTSVASASVTGVAGQLYLAAIAPKPFVAVNAVSGLGLTWTRVRAQCAGRNQTGVEVWQAMGTPSGSGSVTATLASAPANSVITVSRYSATSGVGASSSANTNGAGGACSGGSDSSAYTVNLTTTTANSLRFGAVAIRNKTHTPGAGYTERVEVKTGNGGNKAGAASEDRTAPTVGTAAVNGSLSGTVDWAVVGVEIKP
jgi:acid phosphatase type 7